MTEPIVVYCRCAYAKVVPLATKHAVLEGLIDNEVEFEAVADLCQLSATQDPRLKQWRDQAEEEGKPLRILACYPRAVKWLFHAGGAPLENVTVEYANMRTEEAENIIRLNVLN